MTYVSGVIAGASTASAFLTVLDATITAETGLSKVSSAIVAGTNTWNVYKSAGANNQIGTDWYFAIGYPTSAPTTLLMTIFEGWNTGTALATSYPPNATSTPSGGLNPGSALALPSTGTTMGYLQSGTLATGASYWYSVTVDRVIFGWGNVAQGFYIGMADSVLATALDPMPLYVLNLAVSTGTGSGFTPTTATGLATREPNQVSSNVANFTASAALGGSNNWTLTATSANIYSGFYFPSRVAIMGRSSAALRGLLKDVYQAAPQAANGDLITWTLSGVPYVGVRLAAGAFGQYMLQV